MSKPTAKLHSLLRIGQIAERSGVSAKALRLYERRGLLKPCAHSAAGYRLYGPDALRRLMQILLLKRSGFSLTEIARLRASESALLVSLLAERITALQRDLAAKVLALKSLQAMAQQVDRASALDLDQLLEGLHMTQQVDLQTSPNIREQMLARAEQFAAAAPSEAGPNLRERVAQRLDDLGPGALEAAQQPWRELSAQIRAAMAAGQLPSAPASAELAARWRVMARIFTAKDPAFLTKLRDLYTRHPELMTEQSMSPAMLDFLDAAMAAAG